MLPKDKLFVDDHLPDVVIAEPVVSRPATRSKEKTALPSQRLATRLLDRSATKNGLSWQEELKDKAGLHQLLSCLPELARQSRQQMLNQPSANESL